MKPIFVFKVLITVVATVAGLSNSANASDWVSQRKFKAEVKVMKSAGKIPVSMQCRTDPSKKVFKPQIKVQWRNNEQNKVWIISAYKGQLDFRPGRPEQWNQWRRVNKIVLKAGAGGSTFRCSLFYKK